MNMATEDRLQHPSEILDRKRPADILAEQVLMAAAVRYPAAADKLDLRSEEFYSSLHAAMWDAFRAIRERREPIDAQTMQVQFKADCISIADAAEAIQIGGDTLTIAAYVPYYADRVRTAYKRRTIIEACQGLLVDAWDDGKTVEEILALCEHRLGEIQTGRWSNDPIDLAESIAAALRDADDILLRAKHSGCMTGFPAFDEQVGGLFKGELVILAARPGIGKTSMALQAGYHAATKGKRVYFASLEMSHVELAMKLLCSLAEVSNQKVRNAAIDNIDTGKLLDAGCAASRVPMKIHDWPSIRVYDIRRAARAMKADLVIVDYLQLVTPTEKNAKRYEQVAQLAKDLKAMARELDVPVLALAQLNRAIDQQGRESRPKLSHLRESGDIEQTADMVLLLSRPKSKFVGAKGTQYEGQSWDAELEVAKNRKGATPCLRMEWDKERTLYCDYSPSRQIAQQNPSRGDFAAFGGNDNDF